MQNHRPRQRYAVSLYSERIVSGKIIPIPRSNGTRRPCLTKFSSIRFERDRRFNKLIDRGANVWLNFNSWEISVMNLRVKSIEIVNFLNPLYNRYRSYISSWKLMSNYAREGKERLKYWWKKKEKKKNHPGCTSFLFLLEFPFSTNNRLFIANLPRIGRMIHRLEPTAFKCVPVVGGTLEGRENERRRNLSSLSGDFCFMGQWFLTRMNSKTLVIVLYSRNLQLCIFFRSSDGTEKIRSMENFNRVIARWRESFPDGSIGERWRATFLGDLGAHLSTTLLL